jgi:hypothetical protein
MLVVLGLVIIAGSIALFWTALPRKGVVSWAVRQRWMGGEAFFPILVMTGIVFGLVFIVEGSVGVQR